MNQRQSYFSVLVLLVLLLAGCNLPQKSALSHHMMPDFKSALTTVTSSQALAMAELIEPMKVDSTVLDYLDIYIHRSMSEQQKARELVTILRSPAFMDVEYERSETLTAQQVFNKRKANCISFAYLYITLARHYGLNAEFQLIEKYPQWNKKGDIVSLDVHVNSVVKLRRGIDLTIDIGRRNLQQLGTRTVINDQEALALFYNNLSVSAYSAGRYLEAYQRMAKAIASAPKMALLWSNLGAIYSNNNQWIEAEQSYKFALSVKPGSYTAINNLALLYQKQGRLSDSDFYLQKAIKAQTKNPYYHFYLAQIAMQKNRPSQAKEHLLEAVKIKKDEPGFQKLLKQLKK